MNYEEVKKATEEYTPVICASVDMDNVEGSTIEQCAICGAQVWVAPSTKVALAKETKPPYFMCINCAKKTIPKEEQMLKMPTDEQVKELAEARGWPFEDAKQQIQQWIKYHNMSIRAETN